MTVTIRPAAVFLSQPGGAALSWPWEQIRQTQGFYPGEPIRLERGADLPEALVVEDPDFLAAIRQLRPGFGGDFRPLGGSGVLRTLTIVAAVGLLALIPVFYVWGLPTVAAAAARLVPISLEEQIGQAVAESMAPASQRCTDPAQAQALERLAAALAAGAPESGYKFQMVVADDPMVNAFAAPGGHLVIFRGLLQKAKGPEELAGVLAHEMQHVLQRHTTKAIFRDLTLYALLAVIVGDTGGLLLNAAATAGALRFQRADEESADRAGMKMIQQARIDAQGMIRMFSAMEAESERTPGVIRYLSTHPEMPARVEALKVMAAQAQYTPVRLLEGAPWEAIAGGCRVR